jgi:agmatinase
MLRQLADLYVVSADIVEVAPAYDHAELTGVAASHVGYELLSVMSKAPVRLPLEARSDEESP